MRPGKGEAKIMGDKGEEEGDGCVGGTDVVRQTGGWI